MSCEPRSHSLSLRSHVINSVLVRALNYRVILRREESEGWAESDMGGGGENGFLLISFEFPGHGRQPDWDSQAGLGVWREERASLGGPPGPPRAARPDRLSEGTVWPGAQIATDHLGSSHSLSNPELLPNLSVPQFPSL